MNAEMKANIDALRETVSALIKAMRLIGGSEDAVLSILGDAWGKNTNLLITKAERQR